MEELPNELLSFIFDFVPENSLNLRKVCDDWDFVITKYYNRNSIRNLGTFEEIVNIFYRSKLNVKGEDFLDYIRYIYSFDLFHTYTGDISRLGNVHTLILRFTNVEDVSSLGNVHTLDLSITNVEDVSALGNVRNLDLSETKVKDVSRLGNVRNLRLTRTKVEDVSSLVNVCILHLIDMDVDTSMLKTVIIAR